MSGMIAHYGYYALTFVIGLGLGALYGHSAREMYRRELAYTIKTFSDCVNGFDEYRKALEARVKAEAKKELGLK